MTERKEILLNENIIQELENTRSMLLDYKKKGKKIFVSSSFQTHSIPLLHIVAQVDNTIPVYFLNTGFHFPETLLYRDQIAELLNINVYSLESQIPKINQKDSKGRFFFCSNTDYCCNINKIQPLEPILMTSDIWITGVRKDQNKNRSAMKAEAKGPFDTTRFHPMLNWTSKMIFEYRQKYQLPEHPLEASGYLSVGCEPCTQKHIDGRSGRWAGQNKNECGLHTELIEK